MIRSIWSWLKPLIQTDLVNCPCFIEVSSVKGLVVARIDAVGYLWPSKREFISLASWGEHSSRPSSINKISFLISDQILQIYFLISLVKGWVCLRHVVLNCFSFQIPTVDEDDELEFTDVLKIDLFIRRKLWYDWSSRQPWGPSPQLCFWPELSSRIPDSPPLRYSVCELSSDWRSPWN